MIHHVQIACPPGSEKTLRALYAGVLGLAEKPKPPPLAARGGCWFAGYGIELHLGVEADFRPAHKAPPGLLWSGNASPDRDGAATRPTTAGHPVRWAAEAEFPGIRRFSTDDPSGNRLEISCAGALKLGQEAGLGGAPYTALSVSGVPPACSVRSAARSRRGS